MQAVTIADRHPVYRAEMGWGRSALPRQRNHPLRLGSWL